MSKPTDAQEQHGEASVHVHPRPKTLVRALMQRVQREAQDKEAGLAEEDGKLPERPAMLNTHE